MSLIDLRPGDIMFGPIGGLVPGVFPVALGQLVMGDGFRVGNLSVRHAGVVVEAARPVKAAEAAYGLMLERDGQHYTPPRLVEAMPRGAREIRMTKGHWSDRHAYVRLVEDWPGQAEEAAKVARAMVGTPYSFLSYLALAAWRAGLKAERLARWIDRRQVNHPLAAIPCEAICSVLADQAWTLAGKCIMPDTRPQIVTPGGLAGRLLEMASEGGATWMRPRSAIVES